MALALLRKPSTTRSRLILLVAAVLAPPALFALVLLLEFSAAERARSRVNAEDLAQQLCGTIDRELVALTAALEGLATSPALQPGGNLADFYHQAEQLLRTRGSYIVMRDRTGQQIINSTLPFGSPLPRQTDPIALAPDRAVFDSARPDISDLYFGLTVRRPLILVDAPVFRAGAVDYALHISLGPERLAAILAGAAPAGWTVSLIDRNDRVIARSREHDTSIGRFAAPDLRQAATGDRGTWSGRMIDGTPMIGAYARSTLSGWRVAVGVPIGLIEGPLRRLTALILGSAALVGLLATMLAMRVARTISLPIARLATAAAFLERGEPVPPLHTGLAEVDEVAGTLVAAEGAVRARGALLQASEERFRAAVRAVEGVIWTNDAAGRMTGEQPGWSALTGQRPEEYQGYGWSSAVHPEDSAPSVLAWEAAVREQGTFTFVHRVRRADGVYRRFSIRAIPVIATDGTIREWVGVHTDITDEHAAQASLAESQARLRAVFEAVPVGVVIAEGPGGRVAEGNAQAERLLGRPIQASETDLRWDAVHPDGRAMDPAEHPLDRLVGDGEERPELEVRYRRRDGDAIWLRLIAAPIRDAAGRVAGGVLAILDIDRLKRAETNLRELNATLERRVQETAAERDRIWRISTELMMIARFDTGIVALNPAWTRTLGWDEAELSGRRFIELVHPDDVEPTLAEAARLAEGAPLRFENRYRHRDGSYRWLAWTAVPEAGLLHAIARDVTVEKEAAAALRRTEEQLRQSQKMEVVGQLTGGVAHDFNNLLTVVTGHLEMARRRVEAEGGDARMLRHLDAASEGARRAALLTHRLLAFSRQSTLRPENLDLNGVVEGMADLIRRTLGETVEVATELEPALWPVCADRNGVENAVLNLCVNARDAMPGGGRLSIRTRNAALGDDAPAVLRGELAGGAYAVITVADTGTGIAPELQDRVFEPFFTTKPVGKGTGLGLSQVFGFLRQSGGHAALDSELGLGTAVHLFLPRLEAAPPAPGPADDADQPAPPGPGGGETCLVVEDEDMVREFTISALEEAGYRVLAANDGPTGLRLLEACPDVKLLFTDMVLVGPLDGRQVAAEALRQRPDLRVLFTTGYMEGAAVEAGAPGEHAEIVLKPFTSATLIGKVQGLLGAVPAPG